MFLSDEEVKAWREIYSLCRSKELSLEIRFYKPDTEHPFGHYSLFAWGEDTNYWYRSAPKIKALLALLENDLGLH